MSSKDIIVKINDSATIKAENDIAVYNFTVQSSTMKTTKEAYEAVVPVVAKIKTILDSIEIIENVKIDYSSETVMEYEPKTRIIGYKTNANIQFNVKLSGDNANLIMSEVQQKIINSSTDKANVFINSITYTLSEKKRKSIELEAIKRAIRYAKIQAQMVIETTYDTKNYVITKLDVTTNANNVIPVPIYRSISTQSVPQDNVVSQGVSDVTANVAMELSVNK